MADDFFAAGFVAQEKRGSVGQGLTRVVKGADGDPAKREADRDGLAAGRGLNASTACWRQTYGVYQKKMETWQMRRPRLMVAWWSGGLGVASSRLTNWIVNYYEKGDGGEEETGGRRDDEASTSPAPRSHLRAVEEEWC